MKLIIFMMVFGAALAACGISVTDNPGRFIGLSILVIIGVLFIGPSL